MRIQVIARYMGLVLLVNALFMYRGFVMGAVLPFWYAALPALGRGVHTHQCLV